MVQIKGLLNKAVNIILGITNKIPVIRKFIDRYFILYGIIGLSGFAIDFLIFSFLVKIVGLCYGISNVISVSIGLTNNFFLNRKFNFKIYNKTAQRFFSFYIIGFVGIGISTALIYISVEFIGIPVLISKIIAVVIVVILQYIANRHITFKNRPDRQKK
ncbi:MAG: GtrA family protein [candidate division Zixibacteria bacterium]|nr:GtrA family protein [candidate division Zixibacteria bacterium]